MDPTYSPLPWNMLKIRFVMSVLENRPRAHPGQRWRPLRGARFGLCCSVPTASGLAVGFMLSPACAGYDQAPQQLNNRALHGDFPRLSNQLPQLPLLIPIRTITKA